MYHISRSFLQMCWRIFVRFSRAKLIGCKKFILKNNFKKYIKIHKKLKISTTTLLHPRTLRKITEKRLRHVNSKRSLQLTDFLRSRQTAAKTFLPFCIALSAYEVRKYLSERQNRSSFYFRFGLRAIRPRNITYSLWRSEKHDLQRF